MIEFIISLIVLIVVIIVLLTNKAGFRDILLFIGCYIFTLLIVYIFNSFLLCV